MRRLPAQVSRPSGSPERTALQAPPALQQNAQKPCGCCHPHGFVVPVIQQLRHALQRLSALVRTKKSGTACCDGWLGYLHEGVYISRASRRCWLMPQHLSKRWSPQYPVRPSLLRQNQLAEPCGAKLVGLTVMHDAHMAVPLQQRFAAYRRRGSSSLRRGSVAAFAGLSRSGYCRAGFRTAGQRSGGGAAQAKRRRAREVVHSSRRFVDSMK
jgi:hypothetical protein